MNIASLKPSSTVVASHVGAQDSCAPIQQDRSAVAALPLVFSVYSVLSVVSPLSLCGCKRSARIERAHAS
jgi:hypothetical protein